MVRWQRAGATVRKKDKHHKTRRIFLWPLRNLHLLGHRSTPSCTTTSPPSLIAPPPQRLLFLTPHRSRSHSRHHWFCLQAQAGTGVGVGVASPHPLYTIQGREVRHRCSQLYPLCYFTPRYMGLFSHLRIFSTRNITTTTTYHYEYHDYEYHDHEYHDYDFLVMLYTTPKLQYPL
jgi:hypothetical protein